MRLPTKHRRRLCLLIQISAVILLCAVSLWHSSTSLLPGSTKTRLIFFNDPTTPLLLLQEEKELSSFRRIVVMMMDHPQGWVHRPTQNTTAFSRFVLDNDNDNPTLTTTTTTTTTSSRHMPRPYYPFEQEFFQECQPIKNITVAPTCNLLHELNAFDSPDIVLLSLAGSWRSVWTAPENTTVLKLLQLDRFFSQETWDVHAVDSWVMEQLTASPHVVSMMGLCGPSVITERAIQSARMTFKNRTLTSIQRVRLARDLARGLAELHALTRLDFDTPLIHNHNHNNNHNHFVFSHYDINPANIISIRPQTVQWNDFNLGVVSRVHSNHNGTTTQTKQQTKQQTQPQYCHVPIRYQNIHWRSPEEIRNDTAGVLTTPLQASDVYSLGHVLFQLFTKREPWRHLEDDPSRSTAVGIRHAKVNGELPYLPRNYQPTKPTHDVLWEATRACLQWDPWKRPTAYQLAVGLGDAYQWLLHYHPPKPSTTNHTSGSGRSRNNDTRQQSMAKAREFFFGKVERVMNP